MSTKLSIIIPYYKHPVFLKFQSNVWNNYSERVKKEIEIIIVDDGSDVPINKVPNIKFTENVKLYRILEDIPWNEKGARNLGATVANSDWILHHDFDHWFDNENLEKLLDLEKDKNFFYRFNRKLNGKINKKIHRETHLVNKEVFLKSGGFNEDFSGMWGGKAYTLYFSKLTKIGCKMYFLDDFFINQESIQNFPDSAVPKEMRISRINRDTKKILREIKSKNSEIEMLRFKWERIL